MLKYPKLFMLCVFVFFAQQTWAYNVDSVYVVSFVDKPDYVEDHTTGFLSQRAMQKYQKASIRLTEAEAPICAYYVDSVLQISHAELYTWSKWFNYIVIECSSEYINTIEKCSFVREVLPIKQYTPAYFITAADTVDQTITFNRISTDTMDITIDSLLYGSFYSQIAMHNGQWLHQKGYKGEDMLIAVIDGGFLCMDTAVFWDDLRQKTLYAAYDLTIDSGDMFSRLSHGTFVTSIMASDVPYEAIGTAPEASYALIKTECNDFESRLEEFFLVRGAEIADSLGADVVNISLGYTYSNDEYEKRSYEEIDGLHSVASFALSRLMQKCTFVCVAAGNDGDNAWGHIGAPADGQKILTVAAVKFDSSAASFTSCGGFPWAPHKPDIAAIGDSTFFFDSSKNTTSYGNGTSFAAPVITGLVACLRQAFPDYSPLQIKQAILQSAHYYTDGTYYNDTIGYGIPNFYIAYQLLENSLNVKSIASNPTLNIYPNPVNGICTYTLPHAGKVSITDLGGRVIYDTYQTEGEHCIDMHSWPCGMYIIRMQYGNYVLEGKILKQ